MVDWVGGSNLSGGQNAWEVFQVQLHIHFANNPCMEYLHTLGWLKRGYCYSKYASPMQCSCFGVSAQTSPHTHTHTHTHTPVHRDVSFSVLLGSPVTAAAQELIDPRAVLLEEVSFCRSHKGVVFSP